MEIIDRREQGGDLEVCSRGKGSTAILCSCWGDHNEITLALNSSGHLVGEFFTALSEKREVETIRL